MNDLYDDILLYSPTMRILGIETSCDETAASVVENGTQVLSNVIATSKKKFEHLAGVIPEEAARMQIECIMPVIRHAVSDASATADTIDAIAVTRGPGLLGSLLAGNIAARVLARIWQKPLIGVHHTLGHLSSTWLDTDENDTPAFPILTLSVSGGHTDIWYRSSHMHGTLLGSTRDDAAGEAFDKGAFMLGLPYPGGPYVAERASTGNPNAFSFPLPLHDDPSLDFSFSGLKTALKYLLRDELVSSNSPDIAASFQHAICMHLADKMSRALAMHPHVKEVHVVGGVSANTYLRNQLQTLCHSHGVLLRTPRTLGYCTDNAAMIASAGYFMHQEGAHSDIFDAEASIPLASVLLAD
jgi:N6-L-threonylcarbamoyladenine synthase